MEVSWEQILTSLENTYYTEIGLILATIFAICIGMANRQRDSLYLLFLAYTFISFLCIICWGVFKASNLPEVKKSVLIEVVNISLSSIEISIMYVYFRKAIQSPVIKIILAISITIFIIIIVLFALHVDTEVKPEALKSWSFKISVLEFFVLLLACLSYYFELFKADIGDSIVLSKKPSFWIVTGLFFYILVSLPFFLIGGKLFSYSHTLYFVMSSIHYISFSLFFVFTAKAFSCKKPLTI